MLVRISFGVCVMRIRQQHHCIRKVFIFYRFCYFPAAKVWRFSKCHNTQRLLFVITNLWYMRYKSQIYS